MSIPVARQARLARIESLMDLGNPASMVLNHRGETADHEGVRVYELAPDEYKLRTQQNNAADMSGRVCHKGKIVTGNKRCNLFCSKNMNTNIKKTPAVPRDVIEPSPKTILATQKGHGVI